MTAQERDKIVKYLTTTRDQVIAESEGLSDAQWAFKPATDRWSVGEVVEHLALAERSSSICSRRRWRVRRRARRAQRRTEPGRMVSKWLPDRTKKAIAPEPIQPKTRLGTRA